MSGPFTAVQRMILLFGAADFLKPQRRVGARRKPADRGRGFRRNGFDSDAWGLSLALT